jgi:glycopeptide antibiotics resistance protein
MVFFGISGGLDFHKTRLTPNLYPLVSIIDIYDMGVINMMKQVILNIIIMVPLGFLLPVVFRYFRSFVKIILFTIFISAFVEVVQYLVGRSADIDDVIMNTIGGIIGYMIFFVFRRLSSNKVASKIV